MSNITFIIFLIVFLIPSLRQLPKWFHSIASLSGEAAPSFGLLLYLTFLLFNNLFDNLFNKRKMCCKNHLQELQKPFAWVENGFATKNGVARHVLQIAFASKNIDATVICKSCKSHLHELQKPFATQGFALQVICNPSSSLEAYFLAIS